jgi:hypothetical protein
MAARHAHSSRPPAARLTQVALRSLHIVSMGLLLGGVAYGAPPERLLVPAALTTASGLLLTIAAVAWRNLVLTEGAGWALFGKLGLLSLGMAIPGARLELFLAATLLASFGSHMPASWRHWGLGRRGHEEDSAAGEPRHHGHGR